MLETREYQQQCIDAVETQLQLSRSVMLQLATGAGKTYIGQEVGTNWAGKVLVVVHRSDLVAQWDMPNIATIQAICKGGYKLLEEYGPLDLLILDEAHHYIEDNTWGQIILKWPGRVFGPTATPWRYDPRQRLRSLWQTLLHGPIKDELIWDRHILPARVVSPWFGEILQGQDLKSLAAQKNFTEDVLSKAALLQYGIDWLMDIAPKSQTIIFVKNLKQADIVKDYLKKQHNEPSIIIQGTTRKGFRRAAYKMFTDGKFTKLISVNVLTEGIDLPACDAVLILRTTASLALFLQMVGRCIRQHGCITCSTKKYGLVLDAGGNFAKFGHPDDNYVWTLDERERDYRAPWVCVFCNTVNSPTYEECEGCGAPRREEGAGIAKLYIICHKCGIQRPADEPICPACAISVITEKPNWENNPKSFSYRNLEWRRSVHGYESRIEGLGCFAHMVQETLTDWGAAIILDEESILWKISSEPTPKGIIAMKGLYDPSKTLDRVTNKVQRLVKAKG